METAWIRAGEDPLGLGGEHAARPGPPAGADLLERLFAASGADCLRRVPGRETLRFESGGSALVVKRYHGDQWRDFWHERLRGAVRSPGRRECENLLALSAAGLPVPRALAWAEERPALARLGATGARSACVMEHVAHAETVRQRLTRAAQRPALEVSERELVRELARLVARLHARGWCHRDLYLEHFLVRERAGGSELVLIDCGRARHGRRLGRRWIVKDLAALLSSTPERVGPRARLAFFALYLRAAAPGLGRRARRALARAVVAKARRIAAHAPRHAFQAAHAARA